MAMNVKGYAVFAPNEKLGPFEFTRRELRPDDVLMDILYCGICHSDLHRVNGDWGRETMGDYETLYPCVPGHEIVGKITKLGSAVTRFKIGDLAAIGCFVDSCGECKNCKAGLEHLCEKGAVVVFNDKDRIDGMPTYGGFSNKIVARDHFVLKVPENMDISKVAPILCAGITTYSPLVDHKVGPGTRVGVVGFGGLGHMAIKLAVAMGAQVSVFTRSVDKVEGAKKLGAHHVVITSDAKQMAEVAGKLDFIIDTIPKPHDINPFIATLDTLGKFVIVGMLTKAPLTIDISPVVIGQRVIAGSNTGGIARTQEVLDFCAKHHIVPEVEMIGVHEINNAFERMGKGELTHRFVIDMSSL